MKLEEGMYVRTKWGIAKYIHKLITKVTVYYVVDKKIVYENVEYWEDVLSSNEILKASHNIIDLIEEGDYVNGLQVIEIKQHLHNDIEIVLSNGEFKWSFSKNESDYDIKSIVTKEQFESMSYKVKE